MKKLTLLSLLALWGARAGAFSPPAWSLNQTVYEVNVQTFSKEGTLKAVEMALPKLKKLGVGIIWLMPVTPRGVLKAFGSPYCVKDYKSIDPSMGSDWDLRDLVADAHLQGMHVILDWVGNHTSWDNALIKEHPEFYKKNANGGIAQVAEYGDVAQLDYGNPALRAWMIDAMHSWVEIYDIDGFRCDSAGRQPLDFWLAARKDLETNKPMFMLAESDDLKLQAAFDADYDWGMINEGKSNLFTQIATGKAPASSLDAILSRQRKQDIPGFAHLRFTSNHDEWWQFGPPEKRLGAATKALAVLCATLPGKPLIYNGMESGWQGAFKAPIVNTGGPQSDAAFSFYSKLLNLYQANHALSFGSFTKLSSGNDKAIYAYIRQNGKDQVVVLMNLSAAKQRFSISEPALAADYDDLFNGEKSKLPAQIQGNLGPWEYHVLVSSNATVSLGAAVNSAEPKAREALANCASSIKVDGDLSDAAWAGSFTSISQVAVGDAKAVTAGFKVRWDAKKLYIAVQVNKDPLFHDSPNTTPWMDDSVEVFLDSLHLRSTTIQHFDFQYIVGYKNPLLFASGNHSQGVAYASKKNKDGYAVELGIDWVTLGGNKPAPGVIYGMDISVDIDHDGSDRDAILVWNGDAEDYHDTSKYGDLKLDACGAAGK